LFYVVTTLVGAGDNFYVTAKDPAGPWSEPHWLKEVKGIDPSFFFDEDGSVYIAHNGPPPDDKPLYSGHRAIWLHEFDTATGTTRSGSGKLIVNGGTDLAKKPVWIEAPHLFKRGGFYYLSCAEGGTGRAHSQVIFRSRDIWGPYEPFERPILTQRHLPPSRADAVTCTGHADLVETQTGEWWAVFLGSRYYEGTLTNLDRETFLLPLRWEDGWPIILRGDEAVPRVLKRPRLPAQPPATVPHNGSFTWRDDFDALMLAPAWNFLRTPRQPWYSLSEKPGSLLLVPRPVDLNSRQNPSLIARRQQHAHFSATTSLSPSDNPTADAGLVVFRNETHYFFLGTRVDAEGHREMFLERAAGKLTPNGPEIVARAVLPSKPETLELKVIGEGRNHSFSYRVAGGDWITLKNGADGSILSTDVAGGFVGTYIGMFARTRP
jgi:alpha-N-arabinofuranosidase